MRLAIICTGSIIVKTLKPVRVYGDVDPRVLPAYSFADAARYLRVPTATLRHWALGARQAKPVFKLDDPQKQFLSFFNLTEAHVVVAIRRRHGVKLQNVRTALAYVSKAFSIDR